MNVCSNGQKNHLILGGTPRFDEEQDSRRESTCILSQTEFSNLPWLHFWFLVFGK